MLVSHAVQLNSKSMIENSFGQFLCCHDVCESVFVSVPFDVGSSLPLHCQNPAESNII